MITQAHDLSVVVPPRPQTAPSPGGSHGLIRAEHPSFSGEGASIGGDAVSEMSVQHTPVACVPSRGENIPVL